MRKPRISTSGRMTTRAARAARTFIAALVARRTATRLTRLPSSEEVRGESPAGGSLGIARGAIADPDGDARSYFLGRAHGVGDCGPDGNFEGSGRAYRARRSTARVRPAPPTQTTRGPDRPQGGAPRAPSPERLLVSDRQDLSLRSVSP